MILGFRTVAVPLSFNDGKLEAIAESGFNAAELSFNYEPDELDWRDPARAEYIREEAQSQGLALTAHAPDQYWLTNPDAVELAATVDELSACLRSMAAFGAGSAVLHACPHKSIIPGREGEQKDALMSAIERLAPVCEENGIRLLIETMTAGRITSSIDVLIETVDRVGSPGIGICVDVNHSNLSDDLPSAILRAGGRIGEFHLSDNHGEREEHLMLGEGLIDWESVAGAIADISFDGALVLETNTFDPSTASSLAVAAGNAVASFAEQIASRKRVCGDG